MTMVDCSLSSCVSVCARNAAAATTKPQLAHFPFLQFIQIVCVMKEEIHRRRFLLSLRLRLMY